MKIFKFLKKEKIRINSVLEFQGHPKSKYLVDVLKQSKWDELESELSVLSVDELYPILSGLAELATDWKVTPRVPEKGRLALLKCYILIIEAWIARSGRTSDLVSDEEYNHFYRKLDELKETIERYKNNNSNCPLVYSVQIKMSMGYGFEIDELYQVFIKYSCIAEEHLAPYLSMAYALTEQWGGSHTELYSFCRTSFKSNARFAPLIAYAHYMRWFYNYHWEDGSKFETYFLKEDVQLELQTAFIEYTKLKVPAYEMRLGVNFFAFCFAKGDSKKYLRESLKLINRSVLKTPWYMDYDDVVEGVNVLRSYCELPKI